ncbi:hypothetical protein M569_09122, partial [Genlisea aurea]
IKSVQELSGQTCNICGDEVEITEGEEIFVACHECGFPVCRTCYEYERKEGNQCCPMCKTRYKRIKGAPRVDDDEEEDETDDLEHEFDYKNIDSSIPMNPSPDHHVSLRESASNLNPRFPALTYGKVDIQNSLDQQVIVVPQVTGHGNLHHDQSLREKSAPLQPRPMIPEKDLSFFDCGSIVSEDGTEEWRNRQVDKLRVFKHPVETEYNDLSTAPEGRQPLSRKLHISSSSINLYRLMIIFRLLVLGLFFHYRILHPVPDAYILWLTSVLCEIWFALSWILDQFPKWYPIERETYLDRLSLRYEHDGSPCELASVDIFVSTVDPMKEPPLITANTVLSILAVDYPVDKISCYVSDDGAAKLTFEAILATCEFARKWVPFCKKFDVEPRAPESYFSQKVNYLKKKIDPAFVRERREIKREYEEFKVRINRLVATAEKVPEDGWTSEDGTPWPGNNVRDHPAMIRVFLGHDDIGDVDGYELPRLVYVSREKRPGFEHHKKAGAMNALVRVSAILSNAPYLLNVDCDHYINNSKALREAMCFMMDPISGKKVCYVQFPQRFDGLDLHDRYSNRNAVFFDINMKGLDGLQGPIYVGTGCVFRRQALYGNDAPAKKKSPSKTCNCWPKWCCSCCGFRKNNRRRRKLTREKNFKKQIHSLELIQEGEEEGTKKDASPDELQKKFGQSPLFVASTYLQNGGLPNPKEVKPASLVKEIIHVISCGYENKTEWGKEAGWIYGSVTEDILTGFKMHCHGWRSIYCIPKRPAFKGSAPINLSDRLHQVLRWALGSVEILLSKHCPVWYGYGEGLKRLQRVSYINAVIYPLTSIPLIMYCTLPAICLLTGKFIVPELNVYASIVFMALFISIAATGILEMQWGGVGLDDWWRNEQFWVIGGVSSHLFALIQGLLKVIAGVDTNFTVTSKGNNDELRELYAFKWTGLLIPPTTLLVINIIGLVVGMADAVNNGYDSWGPLFGKVFFAVWVIMHLYPFMKGLVGKKNRVPTVIIIWSILLACIMTMFWARNNPFVPRDGLVLEICGITCD